MGTVPSLQTRPSATAGPLVKGPMPNIGLPPVAVVLWGAVATPRA